MIVEDKNKRSAYHRLINRSGSGFSRRFTNRRLPVSAVEQMKHKPYGGMGYEQKRTDTSVQE